MIALAALLLSAQPQPARPPARPKISRQAPVKPDAAWLTGLWVKQKSPAARNLDGCASWDALFYRADGTFSQGEREGFWMLQDGRVYELSNRPIAMPPGKIELDEQGAAKVVRLGADKLQIVGPDGKSAHYLRCPNPDTPVAR